MGKVSRALNKAETGFTPGEAPFSSSDNEETPPVSAPAEPVRKSRLAVPVFIPQPAGSLENWDERLRSATERLAGTAESFRRLRTLIFHPETGSTARSIMILSAEPQEGKSFVCANLGVSIANDIDHNALLIDCDLRRPSLHNLFGMKCPKGLVDHLNNKEEVISSLIYATGHPKLSIIPAGLPPGNPSELVSFEKMSSVIKELTTRDEDRLIILDSPPFQAAAEALILSQLVDKIVLVVRWGKAGREGIKKMTDAVGRKKIVGVVFNAFEMNILDKKMQGVGYHNYYSESYY